MPPTVDTTDVRVGLERRPPIAPEDSGKGSSGREQGRVPTGRTDGGNCWWQSPVAVNAGRCRLKASLGNTQHWLERVPPGK